MTLPIKGANSGFFELDRCAGMRRQFRQRIRRPIDLHGHRLPVAAGFGSVIYRDDGDTIGSHVRRRYRNLLRKACQQGGASTFAAIAAEGCLIKKLGFPNANLGVSFMGRQIGRDQYGGNGHHHRRTALS